MEYQLTKPVSVVVLKFERNSSCIGDSLSGIPSCSLETRFTAWN